MHASFALIERILHFNSFSSRCRQGVDGCRRREWGRRRSRWRGTFEIYVRNGDCSAE